MRRSQQELRRDAAQRAKYDDGFRHGVDIGPDLLLANADAQMPLEVRQRRAVELIQRDFERPARDKGFGEHDVQRAGGAVLARSPVDVETDHAENGIEARPPRTRSVSRRTEIPSDPSHQRCQQAFLVAIVVCRQAPAVTRPFANLTQGRPRHAFLAHQFHGALEKAAFGFFPAVALLAALPGGGRFDSGGAVHVTDRPIV
ncbi:hypothetical protein AU476_15565 [Cupriavidus sp. UYMSc13B]|nr:hypothetical protein AU476_15565 [Cupriavidus sp. UYMSc13B]